jgi:hypothetical protein
MARSDRLSMDSLKNALDEELNDDRAELLASDSPEDRVHELADGLVPVMNPELAQLLFDDLTLGYPDDASALGDDVDAFKIIQLGVLQKLEEHGQQWLEEARDSAGEDDDQDAEPARRLGEHDLIPWQRVQVWDENGLRATDDERRRVLTRLRKKLSTRGLYPRVRLSHDDITDPADIDWSGFISTPAGRSGGVGVLPRPTRGKRR